jgi:phosphate-selective porin
LNTILQQKLKMKISTIKSKALLMHGLLIAFSLLAFNISAQDTINKSKAPEETKKKWSDLISIRGYFQMRYNRLFETNEDLACEQCDRSWGKNGGFFLRRGRVIIFGNVHERVYIYIQPDFASSVSGTTSSGSNNYAQIRDAYFDLALDQKKQFRLRFGQSKVPFGFENLQSSQNRIPLDRNDALNSAVSNERDLGVFFMWAPDKIRKRFSMLVNDGLKGSGDYGVIAFGAYNGQTANRSESNNVPHIVGRVSYPFQIGNQIFEPGIQAYAGVYTLTSDQLSTGVKYRWDKTYQDNRVALSLVLAPKPLGIQAEYNVGTGPQFDKLSDSIVQKELRGGYATISYLINIKNQVLIPFVRGQHYQGGKKFETDARSYDVFEYEIGAEWQPIKNFEFVAMYTFSERRYEDFKKQDNLQKGQLLRLQAQFNF